MLGLVTIGQSPREDIVTSMFGGPGQGGIVQAGALDDLSPSAIANLSPRPGEHPLVTRLNDRSEVVVSKERVTPLLADAVQRLEAEGATIICVLCTGAFQGLVSTQRMVYPDALLTTVVDAILPAGVLGVIIPHAGQSRGMVSKWMRGHHRVELQVVSPYDESMSVERAAASLASAGVDLIVMDCMGYTTDMQERAQSTAEAPVLLANGVVGGVLASIFPHLTGSRQHSMGV